VYNSVALTTLYHPLSSKLFSSSQTEAMFPQNTKSPRPSQPLAAAIFFCLCVWLLSQPCVSAITADLCFCDWSAYTQHNVLEAHPCCRRVGTSFFSRLSNIPLYVWLLWVMVLWTCRQVSVWKYLLSSWAYDSMWNHWVGSMFTFLRNCYIVFHTVNTI
jgi:hypothetical protein